MLPFVHATIHAARVVLSLKSPRHRDAEGLWPEAN